MAKELFQAFDSVKSGAGWSNFAGLITQEQYKAHYEHLKMIEGGIEATTLRMYGLEIHSAPGVYVPDLSSSTFTMIRALLSMYENVDKKEHVLELGSGSGAVSLILDRHEFGRHFTVTDIEPAAVELMRANIARNNAEERFTPVIADLFNGLTHKGYDAILFNGPLWHKSLIVRGEEALVDKDGAFTERFLQEADLYLANGGEIFFAYSNLGREDLMDKFADKWDYQMITAEYIARTGMIKAIYRATLKTS